MNHRALVGRLLIELLILLIAFNAVDQLTWPEDGTAAAVQVAVSKQQLQPSCLVEVRSAIRSASFVRLALFIIQAAAALLLGSDLWLLWQSLRRPNLQRGANGRQPFSSETNATSAATAYRHSP